jgi:hypothetical protein
MVMVVVKEMDMSADCVVIAYEGAHGTAAGLPAASIALRR